jgi:hypothetical protein
MLILLDPAHGHNTPGKRSPDGTLLFPKMNNCCKITRKISTFAFTKCP